MINDGIEEGLTLDYKQDIGKNTDIAKDVRAFTNTAGGILIYGAVEIAFNLCRAEMLGITIPTAELAAAGKVFHSIGADGSCPQR